MRVTRAIRSAAKLAGIVIVGMARICGALLRGDTRYAGDLTRVLMWTVQQDFLLALAAAQRLVMSVPPRDIERVLVIKLDRIGDMVNTTPVIDALHELFPRARVDVLGHPTSLALLDGDDRVGERIPYRSWLYHPLPVLPPGPRTWALVAKLMWRRYPLVVYLRGSYSFLTLGLVSRLAPFKFVAGEPIVEQLLLPLESLYGPVTHSAPRLRVANGFAEFGRRVLSHREADADGPAVVIHASASNATKVWPPERIAAVADELVTSFDARVHIVGGPSDGEILSQVASAAGRQHIYHGDLSIGQVAGVIAACDLFIGNDSGLSHIAAATGRRVIVLWGSASLKLCRPVVPPERCIILYHDVSCRATCPEIACTNRDHPLECLMRIQVADVIAAAAQLLQPRRESRTARHRSIPLVVAEPSTNTI